MSSPPSPGTYHDCGRSPQGGFASAFPARQTAALAAQFRDQPRNEPSALGRFGGRKVLAFLEERKALLDLIGFGKPSGVMLGKNEVVADDYVKLAAAAGCDLDLLPEAGFD
jgi:hypothetical protein